MDARRVTTRGVQELHDYLSMQPHVRVVAAGKAAVGMAAAVREVLGDHRLTSGLMTASVAPDALPPVWNAVAATHPEPSAASEAAGRAALALADDTARDDGVLLVCLSGGASAMLAVPAAGLTIDDKSRTTRLLLRAGLDIGEVNLVRRHLSAIKGGQLAARARRTITLAISDVCTPVEDDPIVIGSGPTVGDPSTRAEALALVRRHGLFEQLPPAVALRLATAPVLPAAAALKEYVDGPVHPDDPRVAQSAYWLVATRQHAMRAAADTARRMGYHVQVQTAPVTGIARDAAGPLLALARTLPRPACVIASGETVVHVTGDGRGGRNQEVAIGALEALSSMGTAAFASIGTDGRDGPTDTAGAFVDSSMWATLGDAAAAWRDEVLARNDASSLLDRLEALVRTGPTGTNVGDVMIVLTQ